MPARTLTIRGVPDAALKRLRARAAANRRSLNGELLVILETAAEGRTPGDMPAAHAPRALAAGVREAEASTASTAAPDLLAEVDRKVLAEVCRRHHIRRLDVFGSLAHGRATPDSDADVVVDFESGMTPGFGIVRVAEALRPVFGGRRVDLVTRRELGRLHERVAHSARTLYAAG